MNGVMMTITSITLGDDDDLLDLITIFKQQSAPEGEGNEEYEYTASLPITEENPSH